LSAIRNILPWIVLANLAIFWPAAGAEVSSYPDYRAGGLLFGDLYHVPSHHTPEGDDATGAVLRRGYLTFDADFSSRWLARLRFEANQSGEFETYDFEMEVKDLFLAWKPGRHQVTAGLSPTITFDVIESIWGLRYLIRTPLDLQGVPSRDTGFSARGPLNENGTFGYRAMIGAGAEFGNETGDGYKYMGALGWTPDDRWTVDLYLAYEQLAGPTDRKTFQLFVARQSDHSRWGAQYSNQDREEDPPLELASVFYVQGLGEKSSLIGRIDRLFEPSPRGDNISYLPFDPTATATMFLVGWEYRISGIFRLTPNTVVTVYDRNDAGEVPKTDLHLRLTMFLDLE
jgi:hypothetical protein